MRKGNEIFFEKIASKPFISLKIIIYSHTISC